jgi:hypothetical protein
MTKLIVAFRNTAKAPTNLTEAWFLVEERYIVERHSEDRLVSSQDHGVGASACKTVYKYGSGKE